MTTEKEPRAVLRRGRLIATAGVGAAVCVAGLVAAVPAYAVPAAPTITVTAPTQIANDGTSSAEYAIKVVTTDAITSANYDFKLTVPTGVNCASDVTIAAGATADTGPDTKPTLTTSSSCEVTATAPAALTGSSTDVWHYKVTINGHPKPATTLTPANPGTTGTVTAEFAINYGGAAPAKASGTSNLVTAGPAVLDGAPTAAPAPYQGYNVKLASSTGFPAAADAVTGIVAAGYSKDSSGNWVALSPNRSVINTTHPVETGAGTSADTDHYYISLNDAAFPAAPTGGTSTTVTQKGFFLDVTAAHGSTASTGATLVFGTLAGTGSGGAFTSFTFTAAAVTPASASSKYTWTIIANNAAWTTAGSAANAPAPAIPAKAVGSGQFNLRVGFTDVNGTPFAAEINQLANNGIVEGYADGSYGITTPVSRQAFAEFAARLLNKTGQTISTGACTTTNGSAFKDVAVNDQFCGAIRDLAGLGVINGYSDGTFRPAKIISRAAIAAYLFRMQAVVNNAIVADAPQAKTTFKDVPESNPFSGDINWMANTKITTGYKDGGFHPGASTTRQANAAFLVRWSALQIPNPLS